MKRKSSIIKLSIIGVLLIAGIVFSFASFNLGLTKYNSFASSIKLGLDLKGGVYAVYEMDETENTDNISSRMEGTRTRLQNMLVDKGYTEATVVREGDTRLRVEVPDVDDPSSIFTIIGKPASLRFVMDETQATILTGQNVLSATVGYDSASTSYVVQLSLDSEGTRAFSEATSDANKGKTISIIVNTGGEDTTISSPKIEAHIPNGKAIITGMQSEEAAQELADQITSGQFEVKLKLLESSTISATLGEQALMLGLIAGAVGMLLVMIFMCYIYRMFGAVASVSLLIYTVLVLFFLAAFPWVQLTLPGIAGIILSIGMAVDANVIIYERIKEEYREGKSIKASVNAGFKRAIAPIFDSNVTSIIASIVLIFFGTGSVTGFGVTLLIGIVLSFFTALVVTKYLIKCVVAINSTSEKLYNLKRGDNFKNLEANQTDAAIEAAEKKAEEEKLAEAEKNSMEDNNNGGTLANETI